MVRDFVDRVFDGAAAPLLLHLAKDSRLSKEERQLIKRIAEEMEE
jgi:predicted transcriptional regulator